MEKSKVDKKDNFSVALGLTDYINPIMYFITCITIILNINTIMDLPWNIIYIIGDVISLIFGFSIPTVKLLVGLGKIKFSLPVNLVFYVNSGIFISGLMLIKNVLNIDNYIFIGIVIFSIILLLIIYLKTRKFNNIAVLIGGIGYLLIYISLIVKALSSSTIISVVFYGVAICIYLMLIGIGIKADLKDARVHWVIEISNIVCQLSVALGTIILFNN